MPKKAKSDTVDKKTGKAAAPKSSGKESAKTQKKVARPAVKKRRATQSRKRLKVAPEKRGLEAAEVSIGLDAPEIAPLTAQVAAEGGAPIGAYHEPLSGRSLLLASLPITKVEPTPFQRDLSPTHTKRLAQKIEESGAFLDPIIVVRGEDGRFWTPNGRHRLAAAKVLGLRQISCLISPDEDLAFRILALNTEKAHNLKDRSLEVVRMARELAKRSATARESDYAAHFEAPELLTLGLIYEQNGRFAGGAYSPLLRKVDRFDSQSLRKSLSQREGLAARLLQIDVQVTKLIESLRERGLTSPYLRNYVVARLNPVRFVRTSKDRNEPPMTLAAALTKMTAAARAFDVSKVKPGDLALVAAVVSGDDD